MSGWSRTRYDEGMRRAALLASLAAMLLAASAPGSAEETWGYDLADSLMSPYCPGRALPECPSPKAAQLREWILDQAKAGRSRADVEAQIYARFGDRIRQAPKAEGVGLVSYVVPVLVFLAGGLIVVIFLRRARPGRPEVASAAVPVAPTAGDEELERLLDEQIRG